MFGRVKRIQKQEHQPIIRHGRKKIPKQNSTAPARLQPATLQVLSSQGPQPICLECTWEEYAVKVIFPAPPSPFIAYIALSLQYVLSSQSFPVPYFKGSGAVVFLTFPGQEASPPILPPPTTFPSLQEALASLFCLLHLGGQSSSHFRIVVPMVVLGVSSIDLMFLCGGTMCN